MDSFFGSLFEAEFTVLREKGKHSPADALAEPRLSGRLNARVLKGDTPIAHYYPTGSVPPQHTEILLKRDEAPDVRLALKIAPDAFVEAADAQWGVAVQRDVRLPALASLLKAAHLSLFALGGYRYALTAGGHFLGRTILGEFADRWMKAERQEVTEAARVHFRQFSNLVRPLLAAPARLQGTITDGQVYLCTGRPIAWGMMTFVRAGDQVHAVIVPVLDDPESAARFVRFCEGTKGRFEVKLARWQVDRWEVAKDGRVIDWPEGRFEEPNSKPFAV